jgi:hypothetical protein
MKTATDRDYNTWRMVETRGDLELWKRDDSIFWGVCLAGDEPDHASFSISGSEVTARSWFENWHLDK